MARVQLIYYQIMYSTPGKPTSMVSENASRVKPEEQFPARRLSFNCSSRPPLRAMQSNRVQTPTLKGSQERAPLNLSKKHSWENTKNSQDAKKPSVADKQNISDFGKIGIPKPLRLEALQGKQILEFSKNKSKRRGRTVNSSKAPTSRLPQRAFPAVSCFDQQPIVRKKTQKQAELSDFMVGRQLGKGKFGNVFFAVHRELNFVCAIKIISKEKVKKEKYQSQITQQIRIQGAIFHPNVVSLYGFFWDADNIYLILEFCSQGDLYALMRKKKKLQQRESARILKQTLDGLVHLHRNNIIHRDVKPENILISHGSAKIGDFGWAAQGELRKTLCGTPLYLSPEVLLGEEYDQRIDIWALGVLAYQMLLGSNPFRIKTQEHLQRILKQQIQFPKQSGLSLTAKDFIQRVLQKNAKYRMDGQQLLLHPFVKYQ